MSQHRNKLPVFRILALVYICLVAGFALLVRNGQLQLLTPAGYIATIQSHILWAAIIFAAIVGTIMVSTFYFVVFHYQEERNQKYEPDKVSSKQLQWATWSVLVLIISAISVLVWNTAHQVDPYRPISSARRAITVQVVALQWKWLFLYPNDGVASVNTVEIPVGTPINLQLTADAPMNSFWVPSLSGQVFAMPGMVTQLHLMADQPGTYAGSSAEISGDGFSGMEFTVKAVSDQEYQAWKAGVKANDQSLDYAGYRQLAKPSSYVPAVQYKLHDANLFDAIVMQFMAPGTDQSTLSVKGSSI